MKKSIAAGMMIATIALLANETPKPVLKSKSEKEMVYPKQVNAKIQEKTALKQEVKMKSQYYPRGEIATH